MMVVVVGLVVVVIVMRIKKVGHDGGYITAH